MAVDNEIILGIIADFMASKDKVVEEIKKGLTKKRSGLDYKHSLTGETADSIDVKNPKWDGLNLTWDFDSDTGSGLNKGVPLPAGGGGGVYQDAILQWVKRRYRVDGREAQKRAYFVRKAIDDRGNPKKKGWFDEIEPNVQREVESIITESMTRNIQIMADKNLTKKIK